MGQCHPHGIDSDSDPNSQVMLIGMGPGRREAELGRFFVGPSGRLLDATLKGVGWSREQCYVTNLVCYRTMTANGGDRDPTPAEIAACAPRLMAEISRVKPKLIVGLGNLVTRVLFPERETGVRGSVIRTRIMGHECWFMSTAHPAAILHEAGRGADDSGHNVANNFVRDVSKIPWVAEWPGNYTGPTGDVKIVTKVNEAQQVLNDLRGMVTIDFETDSRDEINVDVFEDPLLCLAVSDGHTAWVFPPDVCRAVTWPMPPQVQWAAHNGLFDAQVALQRLGLTLPLDEDTMLISYSLDERPGVHGLKQLVREWLGAGFYDDALKPYAKKRMAEAPRDVLYQYNGLDALYTHQLATALIRRQHDDDVRGFYEQLLVPALNAFVEIQHRGMWVDPQAFRNLALQWLPRHLQMYDELKEMGRELGFPDLNINSTVQLRKILFDVLKLPGGPSTAFRLLEQIADQHPFVRKLVDYRHLDHMVSTYLIGIKDDIKKDGRVHARVRLHGTVSGRLSYTDPPLQTIPDETGVGDDFGRMREIFTCEDPEHYVMASADYTRAELFVAFGHSKDQALWDALQAQDFHRVSAGFIYNKHPNDVTPMERSWAKTLTFGVMYGMDASLLSFKYHQPLSKAQGWIKAFFDRYSGLSAWRERMKWQALHQGEIRSLFGRKRRFPLVVGNDARKKVEKQAVNFPIQADASDATLSCLIELHTRLKPLKSYVLLAVHDSLLFELHRDYLDESLELIREVMGRPRHPELPAIPIELKVGPSWGNMKEVKAPTKVTA